MGFFNNTRGVVTVSKPQTVEPKQQRANPSALTMAKMKEYCNAEKLIVHFETDQALQIYSRSSPAHKMLIYLGPDGDLLAFSGDSDYELGSHQLFCGAARLDARPQW